MRICPVCSREYPAETSMCSEDGVLLVDLASAQSSRPKDLIGQVVEGRYRVEALIGKGGMGHVYRCRHVVVGKLAAMKVLKPGVDRSEGVLARFIREAQTANSIKSRHIAEIFDFGQLPNGSFFVVMELLEGEDLTRALKNQRLTGMELVGVFVQMADTLDLAHAIGIVHRDLKPDNVFLVHDGTEPNFVKLLDFGIAKVLHGEASTFTETGVILGTPYYMSPEQARGEKVDHRSDVYAMGVMMYRAFTGKLPFVGDSTMGVLTRHITEMPEPPSKVSQVDVRLERIILRCLEKVPAARFQSTHEVSTALGKLFEAPDPQLRDDTTCVEGSSKQSRPSRAITAPGASESSRNVNAPVAAISAPAWASEPGPPEAPPTRTSTYAVNLRAEGVDPNAEALPNFMPPTFAAAPPPQEPLAPQAPHEGTSRAFSTTGYIVPTRRSPALLVVGALVLAGAAAGAAFALVRHEDPTPAATVPAFATAPATAAATATATASAPATATAPASASASATASASASATAPASATVVRGGHGRPPATVTTATARRPTDVRSPFE